MELAFSALVIFIIALPGILLRGAYRTGRRRWKIPTLSSSLIEQIAQTLFLSALLHGLWCLLCWGLLHLGVGFPIKLRNLLVLLIGDYGKDSELLTPILQSLTAPYHPTAILTYFLTLNCFAWLLGIMAHNVVRAKGWDYNVPEIRFDNPWFYLFYPYQDNAIISFEGNPERENKEYEYESTLISAVVNHNGCDVIYRGNLADYNFCVDGSLHSVHLKSAERRVLTPSNEEEKEFRRVDGDILILCYSEIKTFNIEYRYEELDPVEN